MQMHIDDFILGETLGEGTFGKVKIASHIQTNQKVAIKILNKRKIKENNDEMRISREITILKGMMHPNIAQLYSVIETSNNLYLIMEYADSGELFHHIVLNQRLSEYESCRLFHQLISGIEYLHKNKIVHRDLKPENILLHKSKIKIVDFGLSNTYLQNEKLKSACGSPSYAAPEMIQGLEYEGLSVDIWSCGIILYAMACGCLPFDDNNNSNLFNKIINGKFELPKYLSLNLQDILIKILKTDPKKRLGLEGIKNHKWMMTCKYMASPGLIIGNDEIPIDDDVMKELEEMNFNKEIIRKMIKENKHNRETTLYYLLLKKKINLKLETIGDLSGKMFVEYTMKVKNEKENEKDSRAIVNTQKVYSSMNMSKNKNLYIKNIFKDGGLKENTKVLLTEGETSTNIRRKINSIDLNLGISNEKNEEKEKERIDTIQTSNKKIKMNSTKSKDKAGKNKNNLISIYSHPSKRSISISKGKGKESMFKGASLLKNDIYYKKIYPKHISMKNSVNETNNEIGIYLYNHIKHKGIKPNTSSSVCNKEKSYLNRSSIKENDKKTSNNKEIGNRTINKSVSNTNNQTIHIGKSSIQSDMLLINKPYVKIGNLKSRKINKDALKIKGRGLCEEGKDKQSMKKKNSVLIRKSILNTSTIPLYIRESKSVQKEENQKEKTEIYEESYNSYIKKGSFNQKGKGRNINHASDIYSLYYSMNINTYNKAFVSQPVIKREMNKINQMAKEKGLNFKSKDSSNVRIIQKTSIKMQPSQVKKSFSSSVPNMKKENHTEEKRNSSGVRNVLENKNGKMNKNSNDLSYLKNTIKSKVITNKKGIDFLSLYINSTKNDNWKIGKVKDGRLSK